MWEAMRGHTRWNLSSEKEWGDLRSSGGWGHLPHPLPALDEALWGLGEPVVRRPEFQAWICQLSTFKQPPPLLSGFLPS